ncbi:MAG: MFS transporter [Chlamydiales bacterium]|nr:MFS transporter [Chlamydiales bacterium]
MRRLLWTMGLIVPLGGLLFGYNTAVISSALLFLKHDFSFTTLQQELLVSIILIGALLGASVAGMLSDRLGRKPVIILSDVFFIIGGLTLLLADDLFALLIGRLIAGVGVGLASVTVPLYLAELSPPKSRGALVTLNQLAITVGILLAYLVGLFESGDQSWRIMFGLSIIPAVIQLLGMFLLPETPNYLTVTKEPKSRNKAFFKKTMTGALIVGLGLAILQQITGINTVIYYANQIFELAGFGTNISAIWASVGVGIVNVVATLFSVWLLDRVGRRPLLLVGVAGMTLSLLALATTFWLNIPSESYLSVISLMLYVAAFAIGLGPVAWLIISEIYPHQIRGRAMSLAIFANWVSNYIVSLTFLTLIEKITSAGAFFLYAAICGFAFYFVFRFVPETKGKTLKQIEKDLN